MKWKSLLLFLLWSAPAYAVVELCGDGIDNDSSGGDLACPSPDADDDGYASDGTGSETGTDCDDTNRFIFPGIWVATGCSAGQAKECQADGTYTACGAPTEGSGTQYFINFTSGTDGGSCTSGSPCKTFLQFVDYYDPGDEPAGYHGLSAGDTLWVMGGTDTSTFTYNGYKQAFFLRTSSGTSAQPIRIISPYGSGAVWNPGCTSGAPCVPVMLETSNYIHIYGLSITGGYGGSGNRLEGSGIATDGDYGKVVATTIYDNRGANSNNPCGINVADSPTDWELSHNKIYDNRDATAGVNENERGICLFTGTGTRIHHNVVYNTAAHTDANDAAGCIVWKHGQATASNEIDRNILWNCYQTAIGSNNAGTHIHHNRIFDSQRWVMLHDFAGTHFIKGNLVEYNTVLNGGFAEINAELTSGSFTTNTFQYNVIVDDDSAYGNEDAWQTIFTYGTDSERTAYIGGGFHASNNNCYYNSLATTLQFCDFCSTSGGQTAGSLLTWANWVAAGYDATTFNKNPVLDSYHIATDADCDAWGWKTPAGGGGGGGPPAAANTNFCFYRMKSL